MAFDPTPFLMKLKGKDYLPVAARLLWLRDEHPDARITTEMTMLDLDRNLAVFRAEVSIPDHGTATGYGSETAKDFTDFIEKAETKSIGRALAALGFGTQFAQELDEGERIVDAPQPVRAPSSAPSQGEDTAQLKGQVQTALDADKEAIGKLPKPVDDMNRDELTKTLAWLKDRARRMREGGR